MAKKSLSMWHDIDLWNEEIINSNLFFQHFSISGYGHIAPKTTEGKIATIFYSIIGIPLMLLCLSNIGDIMASSFRWNNFLFFLVSKVYYYSGFYWMAYLSKWINRFLYWRVCCFVCTRDQKKNRKRQQSQVMRRELIRQQQLALQDRNPRFLFGFLWLNFQIENWNFDVFNEFNF